MDNKWKGKLKILELEGGDLPILSTKREVDDFKDNRVWADISNQLLHSLISARDDLEAMGEGFDRNAISYLQGQCYAIRDLLSLPDTLINSLKTEEEEEKDESHER